MIDLAALQTEIITCERCPRLREHCAAIGEAKVRRYRDQEYWGRPVPGFGDPNARLLMVGLAPGAHGANRTGRMFTGDDSGLWLYGALHEFGFGSRPESTWHDDGLLLTDAYITCAARCAPPDNKPAPQELDACRPFLASEIAMLTRAQVVLAFGRIAFESYLKVLNERGCETGRPTFAHGALYRFADPSLPILLCSYHPSRQNTNTGRLTRSMWREIFATARDLIDERGGSANG